MYLCAHVHACTPQYICGVQMTPCGICSLWYLEWRSVVCLCGTIYCWPTLLFISSLVFTSCWWLPEIRRALFSLCLLKPRALHLEKWGSRRSWPCPRGFHLEVGVEGNRIGRHKRWLRVLFTWLFCGGFSWSCDSAICWWKSVCLHSAHR